MVFVKPLLFSVVVLAVTVMSAVAASSFENKFILRIATVNHMPQVAFLMANEQSNLAVWKYSCYNDLSPFNSAYEKNLQRLLNKFSGYSSDHKHFAITLTNSETVVAYCDVDRRDELC